MATMTHDIYRQPFFSIGDGLFRRCLSSAAAAGALFLIAVLLAPVRRQELVHVEQLPERFARLIIEKPKPQPAAPAPEAKMAQPRQTEAARSQATPAPEPQPGPRVRRLEAARERPADAGAEGRRRAQEATATVQQATKAIDRSLAGLSASLQSTSAAPGTPSRRRARQVRAGRSGGEIGAVDARVAGGAADLGGSAVEGTLVAIGGLTAAEPAARGGGGAGTDAAASGGSAPGVYRSTASLLAVVQKYAAGIQYCYGNELKHDPTLAGKLVVAITVAASGRVTEARIVQNTVTSQALSACALSQIREWRFPAIAEGVTVFQAPFVFTPPR